jgi:hypothetical protein
MTRSDEKGAWTMPDEQAARPDLTERSRGSTGTESADQAGGRESRPVLEVFGLTLQVTNPRLAELLTMDAGEALVTDVRALGKRDAGDPGPVGTTPLASDTVPDAADPADGVAAAQRREHRQTVHDIGVFLGFEARPDGLWQSPKGIVVLTRTVESPVTFAAATHYVTELAARRESIGGPESTALFVVEGQQTVDVFKVAIRQLHLYDLMRTISLDNLCAIHDLYAQGVLDHSRAVTLLVPMANIDVGEIISILHSASAEDSPG